MHRAGRSQFENLLPVPSKIWLGPHVQRLRIGAEIRAKSVFVYYPEAEPLSVSLEPMTHFVDVLWTRHNQKLGYLLARNVFHHRVEQNGGAGQVAPRPAGATQGKGQYERQGIRRLGRRRPLESFGSVSPGKHVERPNLTLPPRGERNTSCLPPNRLRPRTQSNGPALLPFPRSWRRRDRRLALRSV